jgi:hypothetical protein
VELEPPSPAAAPTPADAVMENYDHLPLIEVMAEAETGTFAIPATHLVEPSEPNAPNALTLKALAANETESLEEKFWALMQVLNARGVVTKEEFLAQLRQNR